MSNGITLCKCHECDKFQVAILTAEAEEAGPEEAELEEAQEEEAQVEAVVVLMMVRRCAPMCLVIWAPDEQCNTPLSN